jgi:hypothetical protein
MTTESTTLEKFLKLWRDSFTLPLSGVLMYGLGLLSVYHTEMLSGLYRTLQAMPLLYQALS